MQIPEYAAKALTRLEEHGYESYVVGGCVRDSLLEKKPKDWDVCTSARPEEVCSLFEGEHVIPTGLQHGTVTLLTEGSPLEITTFRLEGDYSDCRHPDRVEFVSDVHLDLSRRDFTINAMAYSPLRGLRDDFDGQSDLKKGIIRCVGKAEDRFQEDALRMLRALRFASRFGFDIEKKTATAMLEKRELLKDISPERIFSELKGILTGSGAGEMLLNYPGMFFEVLPELKPLHGFDQKKPRRHQWDVWGHTALSVAAIEPDEVLRLSMLFHDSGKPDTFSVNPETGEGRFYGHPKAGSELADKVLRRLRCDNATRETIVALVANHEMLTGHSRKALRRLLSELGEEKMRLLMKVRRADAASHTPDTRDELYAMTAEDERILEELLIEEGQINLKTLALGGKDLIDLGFLPGEAIGEVRSLLLSEVLDGKTPNEREALSARALIILKSKETAE